MICEARGVPLAATLTAANRNDISELLALVDRVPPTGRYGKFKPSALLADRAYDSRRHHQALRERGITPRIAKRQSGHGSGLGKERWVVERTIAWLHANRRLDRRYDRRADIHEALPHHRLRTHLPPTPTTIILLGALSRESLREH